MSTTTTNQQNGPPPIPDCIEVVNIDDILDKATKATEMLQQKALTVDKKAEIMAIIKTMAETIAAFKTRNSHPHEHPHKQPHEHPHDKCHEAFQSIKQELAEIRVSIASNTKTYAQIAATALPTPATQITSPRQLELTQARKERAEYEITLSASGADNATKDKLANDSHKVITEKLQQAINVAGLQEKPVLKSVNKMSKNTFRLYFRTPEDAKLIKNTLIDWNTAYDGLDIHKPKYGIVIPGVPMEAINYASDYTATIRKWEEQNGFKICSSAPLKRHPKHKPAARRSLIIFTYDRDAANRCLSQGFFIDNLRYNKLEKYAPHLYICQCFKCHRYGHRASDCKLKVTCGHCAHEGHAAETCPNLEDLPKCVNCNGEHAAWHRECSTRTKEATRLTELRMETSYRFP